MLVKKHFNFLFLISFTTCSAAKPPNVLVIVADDLGYNDVSWHNPDIISPNIEKLAKNGIIFENHYVQPSCTPTRSSLMTGYYPIHTGRQHRVIRPQQPDGLYTNFTLMPEYFKKLGYDTHAIGKWHLGFCNEKYIPTRRGFDSFYGYYSGAEDYYNHTRLPEVGGGPAGYDFRNQEMPDKSVIGNYSTDIFTEKAMKILLKYTDDNNSTNPFFMYLPFQSVHAPLQVPLKYENMYPNIMNRARRVFSGKVTAMDDSIGKIVDALKKNKDVFDNTIILFTGDNGGQVLAGGNNYPLRGNKGTLWEGGTRASSFIYAPKFLKPRVSKQLMHVTDWLPTLLTAAQDGSQEKVDLTLGKIDGVDQWESLKDSEKNSTRKEFIYNIDPLYPGGENAAIRVGTMKLIVGTPGKINGWIPAPQTLDLTADEITEIEEKSIASMVPQDPEIRLFDIENDPTEHFNIANDHPDIVNGLLAKLHSYKESMIKPDYHQEVPAGNPNNFGGFWSPGWC